MRITVEYESSWRNSFLEGNNNEELPKRGRKFIGSMTNLQNAKNFIERQVTRDTVMGILNRLIGDQRKLYQSRQDENYYFKDLESCVKFQDSPVTLNREVTYIRNMTGNTDQDAFSGVIQTNHPMLNSDFSQELWGVLFLPFEDVCRFILGDSYESGDDISLDPVDLITRVEVINKDFKPVEKNELYEKVVEFLNKKFSELVTDKSPEPFVERNGKIRPIRFYAASLYLQYERLSNKYDMANALTKSGKIAGFSKRGFNGKRDFMKNFTTGGEKKIWGNPYVRKERVKGEGEVVSMMTKASGRLQIEIPLERNRAKELEIMIKNAGVSSFYLGKKGLAYVSGIRV